jgi:hypothetical protein
MSDDTLAPWTKEEKVYPLAMRLANTLINMPVGRTFATERIDMTKPCFDELRKLAQLVLDAAGENSTK